MQLCFLLCCSSAVSNIVPKGINKGRVSTLREYCFQWPVFLFLLMAKSIKLFRPPVRSNGRTYKMPVMFSFFSSRNLRAPSADHRETWPHDSTVDSKNSGSAPPKKLGAKNMQNFGRFYTTSNFDLEYLWNGSRYPKTES